MPSTVVKLGIGIIIIVSRFGTERTPEGVEVRQADNQIVIQIRVAGIADAVAIAVELGDIRYLNAIVTVVNKTIFVRISLLYVRNIVAVAVFFGSPYDRYRVGVVDKEIEFRQ